MAEFWQMDLKGAIALNRKLEQLGPAVAKKHLSKALRAGAKLVLVAAKANAPVLTGTLRRSLKIKAIKRRRTIHERGFNVITSAKFTPVLVSFSKGTGKRSFYPSVVEYGTAKRAARPFMRPAFDPQGRAAVNLIMRVLRHAVEKEGAKK